MWHGRRAALPLLAVVLTVVLVGMIFGSIRAQGMAGVLWSYPFFLFVCCFVVSRRVATVLAGLLIAGVTALAWPQLGPGLTLRVLISQVLVMRMVNVVFGVIGNLQHSLRVQAITDALTGAFNRRHLQTRLEALVGSPDHALPTLDGDHFKRINNLHGHDSGDEVWCRLVDRLDAAAGDKAMVFRTGGEESMLLHLSQAGLHVAVLQAEAVRQRVASSRLLGAERITVSIGVAVLWPGQDTRQWLKRADMALAPWRCTHGAVPRQERWARPLVGRLCTACGPLESPLFSPELSVLKSRSAEPIVQGMDGLRGIFRRLWVEDALAVFRDRIAQQLSWFSAFLLLPFTVNHLLLGRYALGCSILLAQIVFLINGHFLRQGRQTPVPMWIMVSAFGCAVVTAVIVQGVNSVFWAFPALFIGYFLMPRWQAQLFSLCLLVAVPSVALFIVGSEAAVRALASMVLTLVMINVVLGVIAGLQHALVHQAITDPLTGAWNRRHFETQLAQMQTPPDAGRTPNVLLALDIDHFKRVNDEHGHAVGDVVLQRLVQLVQLRKRDADQLFRTGGEEFVLLLPRTAVEDARCVAEDLRHRIECTELAPGLQVTVSIGVSAQATSQVATPWLAAADKALYEAKRSGRNRVVMASLPA